MDDVVEINGKKYVSIDKDDSVAEHFSTVIEAKLHAQLKKLLSEQNPCISAAKAVCVMDAANVCMFVPKTGQAKNVLCRYIPPDGRGQMVPDLDYGGEPFGQSNISVEYLTKVMSVFYCLETKMDAGKVRVFVKNDYPLTLENEHFKVIIAPRVESD